MTPATQGPCKCYNAASVVEGQRLTASHNNLFNQLQISRLNRMLRQTVAEKARRKAAVKFQMAVLESSSGTATRAFPGCTMYQPQHKFIIAAASLSQLQSHGKRKLILKQSGALKAA